MIDGDRAKCQADRCPIKDKCERYTCPSADRQCYIFEPFDFTVGECDYFIGGFNEEEDSKKRS